MAKVQTQVKSRQAPAAAPLKDETSDNVPALAANRLPYHPAIEARFGIDKSAWKVLVESTWPNARTPDSVILALSYCKARNLDPYKRPVHIVPITIKKTINGKDAWVEVETVWPAISETRTTAFRTKGYAGMDTPQFGPTKVFKLIDQVKEDRDYADVPIEFEAPEWCQITVHRLVDGIARPFPGPRVYFAEFYAPRNRFCTAPNEQWRRKPAYMLEKCAEATALRRAFPEEYGEKYAIEELGSLGSLKPIGGSATFKDPPAERKPEPKRGDFDKQAPKAAAAGAQEEPPPAEDPRGDAPLDQQQQGDQGDGGDGPSVPSEHETNPARCPDSVLGQDNIIAWLEKAIDACETVDAVEAIEEANKDKIAKFGDLKRKAMLKRADDQKRMVA